ncbi:MAG: hypothetical protein FWF75_01860 [Propionibacteriaceae bacterium]|nr:hypothetical protein [Propionibacteriaceae bacterium]
MNTPVAGDRMVPGETTVRVGIVGRVRIGIGVLVRAVGLVPMVTGLRVRIVGLVRIGIGVLVRAVGLARTQSVRNGRTQTVLRARIDGNGRAETIAARRDRKRVIAGGSIVDVTAVRDSVRVRTEIIRAGVESEAATGTTGSGSRIIRPVGVRIVGNTAATSLEATAIAGMSVTVRRAATTAGTARAADSALGSRMRPANGGRTAGRSVRTRTGDVGSPIATAIGARADAIGGTTVVRRARVRRKARTVSRARCVVRPDRRQTSRGCPAM